MLQDSGMEHPAPVMATAESTEEMDQSPLPVAVGAEVLRESFGDRRPPDITRKITACVACRKQKIRCDMGIDSRPPCTRCKRRNLSCTVNKSLQMLLEEDANCKTTLARKVQNLEAQVAELRQGMHNLDGAAFHSPSPAQADSSASASQRRREGRSSIEETYPSTRKAGQQQWDVVMDPDSGPAIIPAASVRQVGASISPISLIPQGPTDLVVRGTLTREQAQDLFDLYTNRLDHFVYDILGEHRSFETVQAESPLLLAATCTVAALHCPILGHLYDECYQVFIRLCSTYSMTKDSSIADIKGLCIGAFWLSEVSWNLVSVAVRIATQRQLHRSIKLALKGHRSSYLETRLYYLVYVCDHHFSIAYGRPPMTREDESVSSATLLLHTKNATEDDIRLISQVNIWAISSAAFDTFGVDVDSPVKHELLPKLRRFGIALDTWRADWHERFRTDAHVGNYPRKGVGMHFYFAKLYLCSHAFRGMTTHDNSHINGRQSGSSAHILHSEMQEIASTAVLSAEAILRTIIEDPEMQNHLNGLPLYFNTMITFAVVFLLKVATRFSSTIRTSGYEIFALVKDMDVVLRQVAGQLHRQHLLRFIAEGVGKLVDKVQETVRPQSQQSQQPPTAGQSGLPLSYDRGQLSTHTFDCIDSMDTDFSWMEHITNFDFLSTQNTFSSLESWPFGAFEQAQHSE